MKITLNKFSYKDNVIFNNANLEITNKGCYGLVGKNGSGKTTLFKAISKLNRNYDGSIIFNTDEKIAAFIDGSGYFYGSNGLDIIDLILNDIEKENFKKYMKIFSIDSFYKNNLSTFSLGMRKKFFLCLTLAKEANIILLDEPFNGLDETGQSDLKSIIREEKNNKTFIVSSHLFEDLDTYADYYIKIQNKQIVLEKINTRKYLIHFLDEEEKAQFIKNYGKKFTVTTKKEDVVATDNDEKELIPTLKQYMIDSITKQTLTLENE